MARNYHQGEYQVKNWDKYRGTKNPRYLSSYERTVFEWCDRTPSVLEWGAEIIVVPYYCKIKQRKRRYIVDLWLKYKNSKGDILTEIVEIKPFSQTQPPKQGRKKPQTFLEEQMTWEVNKAKWEAADEYARQRGWTFRVITEKSIYRQ